MCRVEKGAVTTAAFNSVPAFLSRADVSLDVPGLGRVTFDLAYGGAFYALLPASRLGLPFFETPFDQLVSDATAITERSEEHTSELQSLMRYSYVVFFLKKKRKNIYTHNTYASL